MRRCLSQVKILRTLTLFTHIYFISLRSNHTQHIDSLAPLLIYRYELCRHRDVCMNTQFILFFDEKSEDMIA